MISFEFITLVMPSCCGQNMCRPNYMHIAINNVVSLQRLSKLH